MIGYMQPSHICGGVLFAFMAMPLFAALNPYVGKMMPDDPRLPFADPFIFVHEGRYYAYGTSSEDGIAVAVSDDLRTWRTGVGRAKGALALHKEDSYGDKWFWAPEVFRRGDGKFILYYSAEKRCCSAIADSIKVSIDTDSTFANLYKVSPEHFSIRVFPLHISFSVA